MFNKEIQNTLLHRPEFHLYQSNFKKIAERTRMFICYLLKTKSIFEHSHLLVSVTLIIFPFNEPWATLPANICSFPIRPGRRKNCYLEDVLKTWLEDVFARRSNFWTPVAYLCEDLKSLVTVWYCETGWLKSIDSDFALLNK